MFNEAMKRKYVRNAYSSPELMAATRITMTRLKADTIGEFIWWARKNASDHWAYVPIKSYMYINDSHFTVYYVGFASEEDRLMASLQFSMDTHSNIMWPDDMAMVLYLYE